MTTTLKKQSILSFFFLISVDAQVMNKPPASGAYVLNKVPVKRRLGAAGGNQPDSSQSGAVVEDSQVRL